MSTAQPPHLIMPGVQEEPEQNEDHLDELYDTVWNGFVQTPISPNSVYSAAYPPEPTRRNYTPDLPESSSSSRHSSLSVNGPQMAGSSNSSGRSRRPLPPTPGGAAAVAGPSSIPLEKLQVPQAPQIPPQPTQPPPQPSSSSVNVSVAPSQSQPSHPLGRSNTTRKSRIFRRSPAEPATAVSPGFNDEGPSTIDWDDYDGANVAENTEYIDEDDHLPLPGYVRAFQEDPNASASLGLGGMGHSREEEQDYTGPPDEPFSPDFAPSRRVPPGRYDSMRSLESTPSIAHRWNEAPDVQSFMSSDYPLLLPPSSTRSDHIGLPYVHEEGDRERTPEPALPSTVNSHIYDDIYDITPRHVHANSHYQPGYAETDGDYQYINSGGDLDRRNTEVIRMIAQFQGVDRGPAHLELHEEDAEDFFDEDERRFINLSLVSNLAVQLRDKVPRGTHVKGSVPYPRAFTGKDIVSTLHSIISREWPRDHDTMLTDRQLALLAARSLQMQLFFYEVEWGSRVLHDGVEDVYMFLDDPEGSTEVPIERAELPSGILTALTKCYSAGCEEGKVCYSYTCPRKGFQLDVPDSLPEDPQEEWSRKVPEEIRRNISENEINRQTIIHKLISKEKQYIDDLNIVESVFIKPLRQAQPPIMTPLVLEEFVEEVFGNILELRDCNRRLLDALYIRQREQQPIIQSIGDILLGAATDFRTVYPVYVGHHPLAEKRMKEELEHNPEFRLFVEKCSRQPSIRADGARLDLKHYLNRPSEHLQKYPVLLEAIYRETDHKNPDGDYLHEAISAINNLQNVAQLLTFQSAMGKGVTGKWEWMNLVSQETTANISREEARRQSVIFELIQGEMAYVRDLENIETMYVRPLRNAEPPIIPSDRLDQFLTDVFHNFNELYGHHRRLVDSLHEIQRDEHPRIRTITPAVFDAVLNFREAYMEYIPNYPIAAYRIDDEMTNNEEFRKFVNNAIRHPDAHRLDMKNFINRPIPRLLRYELLLNKILSETPPYHEDRDAIPPVIDQIKSLGKETEPGVVTAKKKVELWKYNANLEFKPGEFVDMDLLNENRSLEHTGKLLRQPDNDRTSGWTELLVMLFDNYLVMTKPKEKDGITKYHVHRKPIPLDLLSIVNFSDNPVQRSTSILRAFRDRSDSASISSRNADSDARTVYPCTIHHNGRQGGPYILYAESAAARAEWKKKLEEAIGFRKVVQDANKVFEIESLSVDTFLIPPFSANPSAPSWNDGTFTGKVTCSVPFTTPDGRGLVAIGCAEGVWIGYRHDSKSLRRVLHLKMVTQCAMLEDFGLFIVLADKVLFAYHLEALVPTTPGSIHAQQTPVKIHGKDVQFFSVGVLHNRTLVIYMKKRGNNDCHFYAVEPVLDKINERPKAGNQRAFIPGGKKKPDWFRPFNNFQCPDAHDLIFLKAKIAVLSGRGFQIMDLTDYRSVTIPQRDNPRYSYLSKRCDHCRPLGMFRSSDDEFLLCYNEFGVYVDKQGNPNRPSGIIEWEGTADKVAMHSPYVLLFDPRFIEVRHIETGRLIQIIPGTDIRCVWDGRSVDPSSTFAPPEGNEDNMIQEPRVHAVMNIPDTPTQPGGRPMRGIVQHVFELYPTIPLYLPGALSFPSNAPFYPVSFSPPRSPPLRAGHL